MNNIAKNSIAGAEIELYILSMNSIYKYKMVGWSDSNRGGYSLKLKIQGCDKGYLTFENMIQSYKFKILYDDVEIAQSTIFNQACDALRKANIIDAEDISKKAWDNIDDNYDLYKP